VCGGEALQGVWECVCACVCVCVCGVCARAIVRVGGAPQGVGVWMCRQVDGWCMGAWVRGNVCWGVWVCIQHMLVY